MPSGRDVSPRLSIVVSGRSVKVAFLANTDWYLYNFRLAFAQDLLARGCSVVFISPRGKYAEKFETAGVQWVELRLSRGFRALLDSISAVRALRRILASERVDLLHCFTLSCIAVGGFSVGGAWRGQVCATVAGLGFAFSDGSVLARFSAELILRLLRFAIGYSGARVIAQNVDDARLLVERRVVARDRLSLIPGSGVDTDRFGPSGVRDNSSQPARVLFVGRLLHDKGVKEFVEAAQLIQRTRKSVRFLLAGDIDVGNPNAIDVRVVKEWVAAGYIEWLGHVADVSELLGHVDVVALPSYREGMPRVLLEAGAREVPVVACDVPGCRDLVVDGVTGYLVKPKSATELADAIERLLVRPSDARQMGRQGRARVVEGFSDAVVNVATLRLYERMLGSPLGEPSGLCQAEVSVIRSER